MAMAQRCRQRNWISTQQQGKNIRQNKFRLVAAKVKIFTSQSYE